MNGESDLTTRVAALEKRSGGSCGVCRVLGGLLLVGLLTVNAWIAWRSFDALAAEKAEHHFWVVCHTGATDEQRRDAFTELVKAGNREWRSARLSHLKLNRGDFDGAHLALASLPTTDFTQSTMVGANLRGANLEMAKLVDVDFSLANLAEAFMRNADLSDSTFHHANLRNVALYQADLKNADLEDADLTEANLLMAVLTDANLKGADLSWAVLDAANFQGANLEDANLESASLVDTDFTDCNWWRAIGLPSEAADRLQRDFPPSDEAPEKLREDYSAWLDR